MKMSHGELCRLSEYTAMTLDVLDYRVLSRPENLEPKVSTPTEYMGGLSGKDALQCHPCYLCKQVTNSEFDPRKGAVTFYSQTCVTACLEDRTMVLRNEISCRFLHYKCQVSNSSPLKMNFF